MRVFVFVLFVASNNVLTKGIVSVWIKYVLYFTNVPDCITQQMCTFHMHEVKICQNFKIGPYPRLIALWSNCMPIPGNAQNTSLIWNKWINSKFIQHSHKRTGTAQMYTNTTVIHKRSTLVILSLSGKECNQLASRPKTRPTQTCHLGSTFSKPFSVPILLLHPAWSNWRSADRGEFTVKSMYVIFCI